MKQKKKKPFFFFVKPDTNPGILWTPPLVDVPEATVPFPPITTIPKIFNRDETHSETLLTDLLNWYYGFH